MWGSLCAAPSLLHAQFDFQLAGRDFQVHSSVQQGFAYSNNNNFLTMDTSRGSFAMTDAAVNVSTRLTDNLRIGAQVFDRYLGHLDKGEVQLDWAVVDYKLKPWFGIRAGKVKTTLGLFNDTQDMEFLYTFALLPQSMYPTDQRDNTIAHDGGDIYGDISMRGGGTLSYSVYGGWRPNLPHEGFLHAMQSIGTSMKSWDGWMKGADLRWATPVKGLLAGASYMDQALSGSGTAFKTGDPGIAQETQKPLKDQTYRYYVEYFAGKLRVDGEYQRHYRIVKVEDIYPVIGFITFNPEADSRSWYGLASYRINKRVEVGGYLSQYWADWRRSMSSPDNHIYDRVATVRVDLTHYWNIKLEGHFMNGYGEMDAAHGFYANENPGGTPVHVGAGGLVVPTSLVPETHMVVIRTGFTF